MMTPETTTPTLGESLRALKTAVRDAVRPALATFERETDLTVRRVELDCDTRRVDVTLREVELDG